MRLPEARGALSAAVLATLADQPGDTVFPEPSGNGDTLLDEDLQLALFLCYELHYRGWAGVDERWEWEPSLLRLRAGIEARFEAALRTAVGRLDDHGDGDVADALARLVGDGDGPLARYVQRSATTPQFREFVVHRSIYQLKEADPHTWGIPRLSGAPKAALVEVQIDEYGGGRLDRMHAELFRTTMRGLGLDDSYGAYVDSVPAITLATNNLVSYLGLHRRLRGALLGHLAAFEMTSSLANHRYGNGLRRLGGGPGVTRFYDEHVEADAVHEQIAARDLCGGFVRDEPDLRSDVLFGAACVPVLGRLFATHVLTAWRQGRTSLRPVATGVLAA